MRAGERKLWTDALERAAGRVPGATVMRTAEGGGALLVQKGQEVAAVRELVRENLAGLSPTRSKMGNRVVTTDGRRFDSALEADRYLELKALRLAGVVNYFLRQVPFEIAPRVRYRVDFFVVWNAPQPAVPEERCGLTMLTYEDTKGFLTETARVKLAAVRELYGVHVRLLRRADVKRMRS